MKRTHVWENIYSGKTARHLRHTAKGGPVSDANHNESTTEIISRLEELPSIDDTLERPAHDGDTEAGALVPVRQTKLSDVAAVAGSYARERREGAGSYFRRHPKRMAVVIVLAIAAIFGLVMAGIRAADLPDEETVRTSARGRVLAPLYSGGYFGYDDPLTLASVEVGNRRHRDSAPENTSHDVSFGATAYAEADVTLSYRNQHVSAVKTATIGFAERQEGWVDAGTPTDEQVAFGALAGVDENKVLANIDQLLERADTDRADGERSLNEIYENAKLEVQLHSFAPVDQTDLMVIHCTSEQGIATYECTLTAEFTFLQANGLWELSTCTASQDAKTRSLELLEGTWEGSFQGQNVSTGNNCLAGSTYGMTLTVEGFDEVDGETVLNAHVSVVAHFHGPVEKSANYSSGDKKYADEALTCTLIGETGNKLVFEGALPERADGTVSIRLEVDGDSRITATVKTETSYEETSGWWVFETTEEKDVTYTDTYDLRRAE